MDVLKKLNKIDTNYYVQEEIESLEFGLLRKYKVFSKYDDKYLGIIAPHTLSKRAYITINEQRIELDIRDVINLSVMMGIVGKYEKLRG